MATKITVPLWLVLLLISLVLIAGWFVYDARVHRYMCMTWGNPGELVQCRVHDGGW